MTPSTSSPPVLKRLEVLLREQGGLVASLLERDPAGTTDPSPVGRHPTPPNSQPVVGGLGSNGVGPAQIAAAGPRARAQAAEYELLLEAIYEGYLLHYGTPRILHPPEADLGLLAGDRLYALGLARLVALGDVAAVAELADVIALTALAQGAGEAELAQAIWSAGARAVGWGSSETHRSAKVLARAGSSEALAAMRTAAEPPETPGHRAD